LEAKKDPTILEGSFKQNSVNVTNAAKIQGLKIMLKQRSETLKSGMSVLMQNPLKIEANT
jgi:hypothetical protein